MSKRQEYRNFASQMARQNANLAEMLEQAPAGSALQQLNQLAQQIRSQRPMLSAAQAFGAALKQRPDLYQEYERERGMA